MNMPYIPNINGKWTEPKRGWLPDPFFWIMFIIFLVCMVSIFVSFSRASISHFSTKEFACRCCGQPKIDPKLLSKLEDLREVIGQPIIITSGYRCPLHNREVGGARYSQHVQGKAVDIKIKGYSPIQVARLAKQCGFTWTKTYSTWTHIDIR